LSNDWKKVHTVTNVHTAEFIKGMLNEHDIEAHILNKRDSEIPTFGPVELYVLSENLTKAKTLIDEHNQPE
jgi:hypothetical protein